MGILKWKKRLKKNLKAIPIFFFFLVSKSAIAGDMPFVSGMDSLKDNIIHKWLPDASAVMVVVTFLMLAFGDFGDGFKRLLSIVFWLSMAFGVLLFINNMTS